MTVIAWDGVTLAVDQGATCGGVVHTIRKYRAHNEWVLIGTGNPQHVEEMMDWHNEVLHSRIQLDGEVKFPRFIGTTAAEMIIFNAFEENKLRRYERSATPLVHTTACAFGEGRDFAYGALDAGATAMEAVKIACQRSPYCGGPIDTFKVQYGEVEHEATKHPAYTSSSILHETFDLEGRKL